MRYDNRYVIHLHLHLGDGTSTCDVVVTKQPPQRERMKKKIHMNEDLKCIPKVIEA